MATEPLSIRLTSDKLLAAVDDVATEFGVSRAAAINALVGLGLKYRDHLPAEFGQHLTQYGGSRRGI